MIGRHCHEGSFFIKVKVWPRSAQFVKRSLCDNSFSNSTLQINAMVAEIERIGGTGTSTWAVEGRCNGIKDLLQPIIWYFPACLQNSVPLNAVPLFLTEGRSRQKEFVSVATFSSIFVNNIVTWVTNFM